MFENALPTNEGVRFSLGKNNESLTNGKASELGQPTQRGASFATATKLQKNNERTILLKKSLSAATQENPVIATATPSVYSAKIIKILYHNLIIIAL